MRLISWCAHRQLDRDTLLACYITRISCLCDAAQDLALLDALEEQHRASKRGGNAHDPAANQRPSAQPCTGSAQLCVVQARCAPAWPAQQAQPLTQLWPQPARWQGQEAAQHSRQPSSACAAGAFNGPRWAGGAAAPGRSSVHSALGRPLGSQAHTAGAAPAGFTSAAEAWQLQTATGAAPPAAEPSAQAAADAAEEPHAGLTGRMAVGEAGRNDAARGGSSAGPGQASGPAAERPLPGGHSWRPGCTRPVPGPAHPVRAPGAARQTNLLQGGRADGAISATHGARAPAWGAQDGPTDAPAASPAADAGGPLAAGHGVVDLTGDEAGEATGAGAAHAAARGPSQGAGSEAEGEAEAGEPGGGAAGPLVECATATPGIRVHRRAARTAAHASPAGACQARRPCRAWQQDGRRLRVWEVLRGKRRTGLQTPLSRAPTCALC